VERGCPELKNPELENVGVLNWIPELNPGCPELKNPELENVGVLN